MTIPETTVSWVNARPLRRVISALCAEHGYHDVAEALEDVATDYTEPPSE